MMHGCSRSACRSISFAICFVASFSWLPAVSQKTASSTPEVEVTTPAKKQAEAGFPVTDQLTLAKCGTCHAPDARGNMTRISYIRTTPEGWEEAIKRMVRLNGLQLTPDEARSILRYLSDYHGLAPEEAAKVAYFSEHRIIDEKIENPEVAHGCASCHALAQDGFQQKRIGGNGDAVDFMIGGHNRHGVSLADGRLKGLEHRAAQLALSR